MFKTNRFPMPGLVKTKVRIEVEARLEKWFRSGLHGIRVAQASVCHSTGPLAMRLAATYAQTFRLKNMVLI